MKLLSIDVSALPDLGQLVAQEANQRRREKA